MPCVNAPIIAASGSYNQPDTGAANGGSLSATTIFTPAAAGIFRVSVYVTISNNGFADVVVNWADENHSNLSAGLNVSGTFGEQDFILHAAASAIQVSTDAGANPNPTAATYTLYWIVEQLA